ncbi:hypothetical protein [Iodidimonas gelatinilytica]|uniref:hypothetical protein n=1 Tax=Iodidimonas gelatinilytica TaxID=1236966 RepID=UPI00123104A5|nr:hypothetical protein [Iodidimonas gelatinilytica]
MPAFTQGCDFADTFRELPVNTAKWAIGQEIQLTQSAKPGYQARLGFSSHGTRAVRQRWL